MINHDKWLESLKTQKTKIDNSINQLDHDKWINTIPQKNPIKEYSLSPTKKYSLSPTKKYSLTTVLFVCGLLFVILIKNETRNIQKEINKLEASINIIDYNLHQAVLDNEVITSPANISRLANKYIDIDLVAYKKSQIGNLNNNKKSIEISKTDNIYKKKIDKLRVSIKETVTKRVKEKQGEMKKLKGLYQEPKTIPKEIKTTLSQKIEKKKTDLKNLYSSPKEIITLERAGKWSVVQVVKLFLGFPVVPGR